MTGQTPTYNERGTSKVTQARELYLSVADTAARLLAAPEVADRWRRPSSLAKLSVQGLAGHLAGQVFFVPAVLADPVPTEPAVSIHEYYARVSWIGSDLNTPFNQAIRSGGEEEASEGPAALAERVAACVEELRATLPASPDRPVRRPTWGPWSISLDDFITSRLLELVLHSDDLAHSVGLPTPQFPAPAVETVVDLLSRIALRRHGATNVLRALSRSERAPLSISAF
ncbi:maleylpyruvate isomerase N-terminal domain-containing protein [Streptacidiphilus carbonis]|uniref:maleylpyruvate isomerase N-terminal domain-containing protein n=1 Tax=Streptacidiphilus carbonis TaxID=105422 RepID=UPI001F3D7A2F|nr:maleylpyruvate isomerase N-terminal domain-containing protein [Streptacidiphilus carbonis]